MWLLRCFTVLFNNWGHWEWCSQLQSQGAEFNEATPCMPSPPTVPHDWHMFSCPFYHCLPTTAGLQRSCPWYWEQETVWASACKGERGGGWRRVLCVVKPELICCGIHSERSPPSENEHCRDMPGAARALVHSSKKNKKQKTRFQKVSKERFQRKSSSECTRFRRLLELLFWAVERLLKVHVLKDAFLRCHLMLLRFSWCSMYRWRGRASFRLELHTARTQGAEGSSATRSYRRLLRLPSPCPLILCTWNPGIRFCNGLNRSCRTGVVISGYQSGFIPGTFGSLMDLTELVDPAGT